MRRVVEVLFLLETHVVGTLLIPIRIFPVHCRNGLRSLARVFPPLLLFRQRRKHAFFTTLL